MDGYDGSTGRSDFVERFGLWQDEQAEAATDVMQQIAAHDIEIVRLSFADQHGVLRGKTLTWEHSAILTLPVTAANAA